MSIASQIHDRAFHLLFRNMPIPSWVFDRKSLRILDVNGAALMLYGYSRDEFLAMKADDVCPDLAGRVQHRSKNGDLIDVEVTSHATELAGCSVEVVLAKDITAQKRTEETLRQSSELQELLMRMATNFVNIPIERTDEAINEALATIGKFVQADRAYLFRYDFETETMSNTHEWCAEGISREIHNSQNIPHNLVMPDAVQAHWRGEVYVLPAVSDLPAGHSFRAILEPQHIQSLILFPMLYDKELLGFVGFDAVREPRQYAEKETALLKVLAEILANAEVRRRSDKSLRRSEDTFRALVETTSDFIWEVDARCVYTYASPQIEKILGYTPSEVIGKTPFDFMAPDEARILRPQVERVMSEKVPFTNLRNLNVHREGHILVFETSGVPVFDRTGTLRGYRGIDRDITTRASVEEALRENEERLRLALMASSQGLYDLDLRTGEAIVSPEYARMLGYEPDEFHETNARWRERLHPDDHGEVTRIYEDYVAGRRNEYRVEFRQKTKSGNWKWILSLGRIVEWDKEGRPVRMLGTHTEVTERKRAEEELAAKEQRYRTLFNLSPAGIMLLDASGTILEVNDTFNKTHLYSRAEMVGRKIHMLVPVEEYARVDAHLKRILSGETLDHEVVNLRKDGSPCIVELRETAISLPNGQRGILSVVNDISERKRTEDALRESEQKFRSVVQNAQAIIFVLDKNGVFQLSEGHALANLGLQPGQVVGLSALELYKNYPEVVEGIQRSLSGEATRATANVEGHIFDTLYSPYFDRNGKLLGVVGVSTDITERIRSEQMLRESEERYRRFFEEDLTGIFITNPDGTFADCNPAFLRIFGFASREEAMRTNATRLYESVEQRNTMLDLLRKKRQLQNFELTLRRMDGRKVHILENIVGTFDEQGNLTQLMGYVSDKTVQKQLEEHLLQSQKMESLGTLASGIAHDFNNILGIILGHATLLGESGAIPQKARHHTEIIQGATERGVGVVKQLLTFARKTDVLLESVRLNEIIIEMTTLLRETFPRTIVIETSLEDDIPSIVADTNQMHQVLLNLFVNARDAMPTGGRLTVSTHVAPPDEIRERWPDATEAEYVVLSVVDTGVGMDEATRARIFEPFFTTKEHGKGTGLGLATVYGIVQTHKGFIDVQSTPGQGTTFMICFPVQPRRFDESHGSLLSAAKMARGTETILFVEDEPMLQEMVTELLTSKGYTVLSASDGMRASEIYSERKADIALIISDLGLPRMGGDELFKTIRALDPSAKFILASGFIDPIIKAMLTDQGLQHIINKPYHPTHMLTKIREVLDGNPSTT
ncbi:MAG: PAS domain S-box protein [Bacteroidetes bacterium]|nr:PAS domain S-box protein [Bacteroidota bacterium]MCW5894892.1 PAS domain S-box protein [Bacteroidota bacterium]